MNVNNFTTVKISLQIEATELTQLTFCNYNITVGIFSDLNT